MHTVKFEKEWAREKERRRKGRGGGMHMSLFITWLTHHYHFHSHILSNIITCSTQVWALTADSAFVQLRVKAWHYFSKLLSMKLICTYFLFQQYMRKADFLEQHQKDLKPVTIKIKANTISVSDLLDRDTPILRPIDEAQPLPPIVSTPPSGYPLLTWSISQFYWSMIIPNCVYVFVKAFIMF